MRFTRTLSAFMRFRAFSCVLERFPLLERMRWKAYFLLKGEKSTRNFGLSSNKTPPTVLELKPFEKDVIKLSESIKFRHTKNYFQDTLANDLKRINLSDKMFVFADKTRNIYEASLNTYNKLLHDNITKTYKHGSEENISEINNELNHIANKLHRLATGLNA